MEAYKPKDNVQEPSVSIGDVVLLKDDHTKRIFWKMCKILELFTGKDGSVRAAKVQVADGKSGKKVINRPLKLLVPLEIASACADRNNASAIDAGTDSYKLDSNNSKQITRSKRSAALIGEMLRRDNE